jgi:hypothetical protein
MEQAMAKLEAKLTDPERLIIAHALSTAAAQYENDAATVADLALRGGLETKAAADTLGEQLRREAADARQLRDKITFLWSHLKL